MLRGVNSARGKGVDTLLHRGKAGVLGQDRAGRGDSYTGMSGGEGSDRSALHGGLRAANALP